MSESTEEINEFRCDGCAPEICVILYKQSIFTNANWVFFFLCLSSLHVAAQSAMSLAVNFPNGFLTAHVGNSVY